MEKRMIDSDEKHQKRSALVTDIAIGMSDGLAVPFALAAGLSGVVDSTNIVLLAGIIAVGAGAISMGIGGYYAAKSEMEDDHANDLIKYNAAAQMQGKSKEEIKAFYAKLGLPDEIQQQAAEEVMKDKEQWDDILLQYQTGLMKTSPKQAVRSGVNIGLAYTAGGLIPLSPYLFLENTMEALRITVVITLIALFIFGWFKSKIKGMNPWLGALRIGITGALAAGAAFLVARFFEA